jgi:hypothetical protein
VWIKLGIQRAHPAGNRNRTNASGCTGH